MILAMIAFASIALCETHSGSIRSPLSIVELRELVGAQREKVGSISFRYHVEANVSGPGQVTEYTGFLDWDSDGRIGVASESSTMTRADGSLAEFGAKACAFDGSHSVHIGHDAKTARQYAGPTEHTTMLSNEICQLNLFLPCKGGKEIAAPQDLLDSLNCENATVRPVQELVKDRLCNVVDVRRKPDGPIWTSIWIDVERAGLVMKWMHPHANGEPSIAYEADEVHEVAFGVWFAVTGNKSVTGHGTRDNSWRIEVPRKEGAWEFTVNAIIDPEKFAPVIPSGYAVIDVNNEIYTQP